MCAPRCIATGESIPPLNIPNTLIPSPTLHPASTSLQCRLPGTCAVVSTTRAISIKVPPPGLIPVPMALLDISRLLPSCHAPISRSISSLSNAILALKNSFLDNFPIIFHILQKSRKSLARLLSDDDRNKSDGSMTTRSCAITACSFSTDDCGVYSTFSSEFTRAETATEREGICVKHTYGFTTRQQRLNSSNSRGRAVRSSVM